MEDDEQIQSNGMTVLDMNDIPDAYDVKKMVDMMKNTAMMPINSTGPSTTTLEDLANMMVNVEIVNQFALAGDLLATGDLTPKEWFKLKMLIRSENPENNKLAEEILKAKAE